MPTAWRIVKEDHGQGAFSGDGASKTGGRWNSRGVRVVYTSEHKSLAALESLVHIDASIRLCYLAFRLHFDETLVERISASALPSDWLTQPPPFTTKQIGDAWARGSRSAILAVPSVIISEELNYLLNPAHPDYPRITVGRATEFAFDRRLLSESMPVK